MRCGLRTGIRRQAIRSGASPRTGDHLLLPPHHQQPTRHCRGPDGALWFTNFGNNSIGRITTDGSVTNYPDSSITTPSAIAVGSDDALWFTNAGRTIGRVTTAAVFSYFTDTWLRPARHRRGSRQRVVVHVGLRHRGRRQDHDRGGDHGRTRISSNITPRGITKGPDGEMWFTTGQTQAIGHIVATVAQTITFTAPASGTVGDSMALSASASSGLAVTLSVDAATTNGSCSLTGGTVHYLHAGPLRDAANQPGDADTAAAPEVNADDRGWQGDGRDRSRSPRLPPGRSGEFAPLSASASSGLPVTFLARRGRSTNGSCSLTGSMAHYLHAGSCVIAANQPGGAETAAAPEVKRTIAVGSASETITFTAPASGTVGDSAPLSAKASSGLPVTLSLDAATTNAACSLTGSTVDYHHAGSCVIDANQPGEADTAAAPEVQRTIAVGKAAQTIAFSAPASGTVGDSAPLSANAASGLPVTLSIDAATTNGSCSLTGNTVHYLHPGACVIDANQPGNADTTAAPTLRRTIAIGKASQAITFTAPASGTVGDSAPLSASASSGLPVTFSLDAATTNEACSLTGSTVHYHHAGSCVIDAKQPGNADSAAAPTVARRVTVGQATRAITFTSTPPPAAIVRGPTYSVTATGGASGNPITFSSGAPTVCVVFGSTLSFVSVGICTIDAHQAGDADYQAGNAVQSFVVAAAPPGPKAKHCVVPKLRGKRLPAAKRALRKAHCAVGRITRRRSSTVRRRRVISSRPKAKRRRPAGTKVAIAVSRGRR